jgi:hypothetical protein
VDARHTETQIYPVRGRNFKRRPGMVVVHNHVMHTVSMMSGLHGFRVWQQAMTGRLVKCKCRWNGIEHYRVRGLGDGRSNTSEEIAKAMEEFNKALEKEVS